MKRKFFALIMAAVLCLGMSTTAFAAVNDSPEAPNGSPEAGGDPTFTERVYSNAEIAAGGGYLEEIADEDMQREILDRIDGEHERLAEYTYSYTYTYTDPVTGQEYTGTHTVRPYAGYFFAFDVQGVESGQVTVHLNDQGDFMVSDFVNYLVSVSHYNVKTNEWEVMDDFAVIDENGNVTFAFESYSPVLLSVLYTETEDVADDENFTILETTYDPVQTLTSEPPAGNGGNGGQGGNGSGDNGAGLQNGGTANGTTTGAGTAQTQTTAPKTGDSNLGQIILLAGAAAVCGAFFTRKKEA